MTYEQLKSEFRLCRCGDPWGEALSTWFTIADEIFFNRDELTVPDDWHFKPSPFGLSNELDSLDTRLAMSASDGDLMRFGHLMHRYTRFLKHLGLDY